ncbi:MAG: hypothetical protein J7K84_09635 [Deltaproteobacteria bacterium]|nr:hypothetical protein [Deltaproteobacteria bacterium]
MKTGNSNAKDLLERHLFPDILIDQIPAGTDAEVDDQFRHISFGKLEKSFSESSVNQFDIEGTEDFEQNEMINIKEAAYSEGFEKGKESEKESEKKILISIVDELREAFVELEEFKKSVCLNAEKAAVKLSLCIAEKILHAEIEKNDDSIIKIIKESFKKIMDNETTKIKINPYDLSYIQNAESLEIDNILAKSSVNFEADAEISRGGCVLETDSGEIDARIESQLMVIKEVFLEEILNKK